MNIRSLCACLLPVGLAAFLAGCHIVPNAPHQVRIAPPSPDQVRFMPGPQDGYRFAAIEFDDSGDVFSMAETDRAIAEIAEANREAKANGDNGRGAMVVLFIHGWKHNAADDDENLKNFRETMAELVKEERMYIDLHNSRVKNQKDQLHVRPYVGVYIGWRGDSLHFMPAGTKFAALLRNLSYYDRNAAASRVAGITAVEVLSDLFHAAKDGSPSTITVAVGHSMGGLILEQSMIYYMAAAVKDRAFTGVDAARPADLVVMVNQASPAMRAQYFLNLLRRAGARAPLAVNPYTKYLTEDQRKHGPLMIAVTSVEDKATDVVFRVANRALAEAVSLRGEYQRYLMTTTAGHAGPLWSHVLTVTNAPPHTEEEGVGQTKWEPIAPCSDELWQKKDPMPPHVNAGPIALCFSIGDHALQENQRTIYRLTAIARKADEFTNDTPYWIVPVGGSVISSHSDIFNPVFRNLLRGLVHYTTEGFDTFPRLETHDPYALPYVPPPNEPSGPTPADRLFWVLKTYRWFPGDALNEEQRHKLREDVQAVTEKICPTGPEQWPDPRCEYREQPPDVYRVEPGDWLSKLAARFYGDARFWGPIYAANRNIENPDLIYPGQLINVPEPCRAVADTPAVFAARQ